MIPATGNPEVILRTSWKVGLSVTCHNPLAKELSYVTNLELISTGRSPSDYRPSTISRADIYDLQYHEAQQDGAESLICLKVCMRGTLRSS
jgi:hypothetical protein